MTIWAITLFSIGLFFSFCSATWWAWAPAIVTLVISSLIACTPLNTAKILAIVGAAFAFITLILQITLASLIISRGSIYCDEYSSSYYYGDDYYSYNNYGYTYTSSECETASAALGAIGIIGAFLWLGVVICCTMLAIKMYPLQGGTPNSSYIAGSNTARPQDLEPDIEVAKAVPVAGTVKIVETINPDGSKTIEKTVIDANGSATVSVTTENYEADEA